MKKNDRYYRVIKRFMESKFSDEEVRCEDYNHKQSTGFYFIQKKYFLGCTLIFYEIERPTHFKVAFDYELFREIKKFVPVRGYKQFARRWLFENKFKDFKHKEKLIDKFSYYR